MITKLRIKNFKCFQDTGELNIRPLTFLVGPNSSGKSSILQMLLMLRQTVDSTDLDNPLAANDGWIQMGAYPEFIYKGEKRRDLEINLEFVRTRLISQEQPYKTEDIFFYLKSVFYYNSKTTQIELKESEFKYEDKAFLKITKEQKRKKYSASISTLEKGQKNERHFNDVKPIKFFDFRPTEKEIKKFEKGEKPVFAFPRPRFLIEREFINLFYLGPLREFPKRLYITSGQAPQDVGIKGERAVDVLWFSHRSGSRRIRRTEKEVKKWFKEFSFANDIRLAKIGKGNDYRVVIIDPATGFETSLANIGFGASQTLPIIVESFYAPPVSLIIIEQPEIHLHPKAQSILGDLFIEAVVSGIDRTFIIETHSEHILARIRRRIAEKKINKEDVAIYYFEPTSEGTKIHRVTLNDQGQYEDFPEGFFEEDVMEAFEHLKAIKQSA